MTKANPLVSIIIPTYNRANLIGETLDSIVAQTYTNWECIVVDDGSTDNTDQIIKTYLAKDSRFQYYHRPKNRLPGGNAARNFGFEKCNGDFVTFLDSDDIFHAEAIDIKIMLMQRHNSDVVISKHTTKRDGLIVQSKRMTKIIEASKFDIEFILARNSIITSDPLIRSKFVENSGFDESLRRFQDHEFFIRLFRQVMNICFTNDILYYHRPNPKSITAKTMQANKIMIDAQVAIHKKMNLYYTNKPEVIGEYRRKAKKMYKGLVRNGHTSRVIENFAFFRNVFGKSYLSFLLYFVMNVLFKKGFDRMN